MITGAPFCDFVVYTYGDLFVERIIPNVPDMEDLLTKLSTLFQNHAVDYFRRLEVQDHTDQ